MAAGRTTFAGSDTEPAETLSLFSGVDDAINRAFQIPSYGHRSQFREVVEKMPRSFNGIDFVETIFRIVTANWDACVDSARRKPSRENWRWLEPKADIAAHNASAEVRLERALIRACVEAGRTDWSNQIPLASGLMDGSSYRRKAVDLIHRRGERAFELIELKVASNNPLYAAMEILQYGLVWLLSRRDRETLGYAGNAILEADDVLLVVLAPDAYFEGRNVQRIGKPLDTGLAALGQKHGVRLGFRFQAFPRAFQSADSYDPGTLLSVFDTRRDL